MDLTMDLNVSKQEADFLGAVEVANHLLRRFGINKTIKSIKDCDGDFFLTLYEALTGELPDGVKQNAAKKEEKIMNCQLVIDALSKEVLETDLSHIEGADIVNGSVASIANLLEIFVRLLEFIFEELEKDEQDADVQEGEFDDNDSNILSSEHDILSDVIQEEFGSQAKIANDSKNKTRKGSENIMEKYLMRTEVPTHDTDEDSTSAHDFTQDSLYRPDYGKESVRSDNLSKQQQTFKVQPFAYVTSSSSNSTEDLAGEAELYSKNMIEKQGHLKSASTSRLDRKTFEEKPPLSVQEFRKTDPVLQTSLARQKHKRVYQSPKDSMSSASWPSILSANALDAKTVDTPFRNVGVRPRDPLPCEVDSSGSDTSSSVKHQHTHHHYYHYKTPNSVDDKNRSGLASVRCSKSKASPNGNQAFNSKAVKKDVSFDRKIPSVPDIRARERSPTKMKASDRQQRQKGDISSGAQDSSVRHTSSSKDAKNTSQEGKLDKNTQPIRMRSVQTSVSDIPTTKENEKQKKNDDEPEGKIGTIPSRIPSDRSSISELNDLLNAKSDGSDRARTQTLKELDKKLEEVRASVKKLENDELLSADTTTANIQSLQKYLDESAVRFRSPTARDALNDEGNDSICSDSEFDYGSIHHQRLREMKAKPIDNGRKEKRNITHLQRNYDGYEHATPELRERKKKQVHFKDFVNESRDERLERLIRSLKQEDKENEEMIDSVKKRYSRDLKEVQKKQKIRIKEDDKRFRKMKPSATESKNNCASRLARIYGQRARKPERGVSKQRKRSASCSPVPRARRKGRLVVEEDDILPLMEDEFPHLYLSPVTAKLMWQKQMRQISNLAKAAHLRKPTLIQKQIEESKKKQESLMNIMKKELEHNKRLKEAREKAHEQRQVKNKLRERRLASARARRYYDDYQVRMRARMLKRRTKEEKIFKQLFVDALEIQKQRVRELRSYAKEQRAMDTQRKQNELESIDNFYRDQFAMMAETVARDRYDIQVREKAQTKVIENMRKGIRERMENDIKCLQEELVRDEDSAYFRQLDAENLRRELQLANYKVRM